MTATDTVQRIAAQISTGTPDKPLLKLEINTEDPLKLEGAIHAVLDYRGRRFMGCGKEWFLISRDELVAIYEFIAGTIATEAHTNSNRDGMVKFRTFEKNFWLPFYYTIKYVLSIDGGEGIKFHV